MKHFLIALTLLIPAAAVAEQPPGQRPSKSALIAAAREAKLEVIDYGQQHCDRATTVDDWLKSLTSHDARVINWSGGECQLVSNMRPGIDASSWPWCAQARITLVHPKDRHDIPMIEIYLEKPNRGRPGAAYAFRAAMITRDGPDYLRFRQDFEAEWRDRFPPDADAAGCSDDDSQ
jgi:hypothetical protein